MQLAALGFVLVLQAACCPSEEWRTDFWIPARADLQRFSLVRTKGQQQQTGLLLLSVLLRRESVQKLLFLLAFLHPSNRSSRYDPVQTSFSPAAHSARSSRQQKWGRWYSFVFSADKSHRLAPGKKQSLHHFLQDRIVWKNAVLKPDRTTDFDFLQSGFPRQYNKLWQCDSKVQTTDNSLPDCLATLRLFRQLTDCGYFSGSFR